MCQCGVPKAVKVVSWRRGQNTPVTEKSEEEVGVPPSADFAVTLFFDLSPLIILR